jgi:type II secretory pathway component GspD/PulD (secretin)
MKQVLLTSALLTLQLSGWQKTNAANIGGSDLSPKPRVVIEAVIFEVELTKSVKSQSPESGTTTGSDYSCGAQVVASALMLQSTRFDSCSPTNKTSSAPAGLGYVTGLAGVELEPPLRTLASNSQIRVLQRPRIQTTPGVATSIFVGKSRPYPTGSYFSAGKDSYCSIQQMQVGATLEVTPFLTNGDGMIHLNIHQRIDEVKGTVNIANVGDVPITGSREFQARIAVRHRELMLLGGMIADEDPDKTSGVPILKNVPVLGAPFRWSAARKQHELMVLLRTTVVPGG